MNGDTEDRHSARDAQTQQAFVDGSGSSDTDTSRGDNLETHRNGIVQHSRSASIKKPFSFKSVSVTKNFLAKTATAAPTLRGSDKGIFAITMRMLL